MTRLDDVLVAGRRLMNEGLYSQTIEEYGKAIELLFRELYTEYLPQLSYPEKESLFNFEKNLKNYSQS